MKRIVAFLILFSAVAYSVNAQLKIGVFAAPQIGTTTGLIPFKKNVVNQKNLPTPTSFAGGLVITYDSYIKPWGVQFAAQYSAQNQNYIYNYKINDEAFTHRGKRRFNYLKFSLVARKSGYVHKYVKSIFFFGPQFSYQLRYSGGALVYKENEYFDLPPTSGIQYYKKYSIDAVLGWELNYAVHKKIDLFTALRLDYGITNIEIPGVQYNGVPVFTGSGTHLATIGLQVGAYYVFSRRDHLLLPTNLWRYRAYKKKKIKGRK